MTDIATIPCRACSSSYRHMLPTDDPHPVLFDIARFLADNRMRPTTFGKLAIDDPFIVEDLRRGRDVRRRTERRLRAFMEHYEA